MPRINLLPWREELRTRRQKEFAVTSLVAVVLTAAAAFAVHVEINNRIEFQQQRNQFLEQQTAALDKKIEEIKTLETEKSRLLARMQIIERLQTSRPEIVHLFDEFSQTVPDGVYYTRITQRGRNFNITGVAQSNARVSSLMRNLNDSTWLANPALVEIKARNQPGENEALRLSDFGMNVGQRAPAGAPGDEG